MMLAFCPIGLLSVGFLHKHADFRLHLNRGWKSYVFSILQVLGFLCFIAQSFFKVTLNPNDSLQYMLYRSKA